MRAGYDNRLANAHRNRVSHGYWSRMGPLRFSPRRCASAMRAMRLRVGAICLPTSGAARETVTTPRSCGACNACCIYLDIDELDKREHQRCRHLRDDGCSIYQSRPRACKTFFCLWRLGFFAASDRPDKAGLLAQAVQNSLGGFGVNVVETRAGAVEAHDALISRCIAITCRLVDIRHIDGRRRLHSSDVKWIDNLRTENHLPLPPNVAEVAVRISSDGAGEMSVRVE